MFPIAASPDWETHRPSQDSKVIAKHAGVEDCDTYFNAGVLALDLNALREEQFASRACDLLSELGEHASYADQSAFNALLAERWHALPMAWNTPSWAFDQQRDNTRPALLHYTNSAPWLKRRYTPSQALFERIARDLGVELPRPEISLVRSCLNAFAPGCWLPCVWYVICCELPRARPQAKERKLMLLRKSPVFGWIISLGGRYVWPVTGGEFVKLKAHYFNRLQ